MREEAKRKALLFVILALLAIALIAAGLPRLEFQPGMPLPGQQGGALVFSTPEDERVKAFPIHNVLKTVLALLLAAFLLYVLYRASRGVRWKDALALILRATLFIALVVGILLILLNSLPPSSQVVAVEPLPTPLPAIYSPLGEAPPLVLWLAVIGLAAAAVSLAMWFVRSNDQPVSALRLVELEAEKARLAILTGDELKNVIIHCYRQMGLALQQEQGIEREEYMTAREFERLLGAKGIPYEPVHQLTQLFEAVRYGAWLPGRDDDQNAVRCLDAIVRYSQGG